MKKRISELMRLSRNGLKQFLKKILPPPFQEVLRKIVHLSFAPTESASIYPKTYPKTPPEERRIFDALKDRFQVVFDVGARNELSFYVMKPDCEYHLFEPNEQFISELQEQVVGLTNHHIIINSFGLSDVNLDNCVYYENSQSFIVNPHAYQGGLDTGKRYSVRTLDSYIVEHNISHIDYLMIDAEGLDYKIIVGGLDTIQNNKVSCIQFEYWDGLKKFVDILQNYQLYLMMEPVLLKAIKEIIAPVMTPEERQIDFNKSIIEVNNTLVDLIDFKVLPTGNGGNILGINKNIPHLYSDKLVFDIMNDC